MSASEDVAANLFDPFVTSKSEGNGLGLALVAKVVGDLGGIVEFDTSDQGTEFRLRLPMYVEELLDDIEYAKEVG